jgi:hypothetical protein
MYRLINDLLLIYVDLSHQYCISHMCRCSNAPILPDKFNAMPFQGTKYEVLVTGHGSV